MQWPAAVVAAQHFFALSSHFILAFSQLLFIVGGAGFGPVPAIAGGGWTSTPGNLTRAKDAAYGHARYLLAQNKPVEGGYSPETGSGATTLPGSGDRAAA